MGAPNTGNADKVREVQALISEIECFNLDLPEIQAIDPQLVIAAKLGEARKYHAGALLVEDTSLTLDGMGGLPGPLIKWFMDAIGMDGIVALTTTFGTRATARTLIGYADEQNEHHFFAGTLSGQIVPPRGSAGFGWDAIFQPDGQPKTFAEMNPDEKSQFSMRRMAVEALRAYLATRENGVIAHVWHPSQVPE